VYFLDDDLLDAMAILDGTIRISMMIVLLMCVLDVYIDV